MSNQQVNQLQEQLERALHISKKWETLYKESTTTKDDVESDNEDSIYLPPPKDSKPIIHYELEALKEDYHCVDNLNRDLIKTNTELFNENERLKSENDAMKKSVEEVSRLSDENKRLQVIIKSLM